MTKKAVFAALIFVIVYNLFLYETALGLSFGIFFFLLNIYLYITRTTDSSNTVVGLVLSSISTIAAFLFSFRANEVVQTVNALTAITTAGLAFYFYKLEGDSNFTISEFVNLPFNMLAGIWKGMHSIVISSQESSTNTPTSDAKTPAIIRGFSITIPVVGILLLLLYNADPIFAKIMKDFIDSLLGRAAVSLFLFSLLIIAYRTIIHKKWGSKQQELKNGSKYEPLVLNISVAIILGLFVAIQLRYVFMYVSEEDLKRIGIASLTYSEYVRQGFFQLLIAAALSSTVVLYALRYVHQLNHQNKSYLALASGLVTIETAILLLSAAKRVLEYNAAHGLTRARLVGIIFLAWLLLMLIYFFIRILKKNSPANIAKHVLALFVTGLLMANLLNIDGLVANQFKPTVNKEVDYFYIASLSTDAYPAWGEAIRDAESTYRRLEGKPLETITTEDNRKLTWSLYTLERLYYKKEFLIQKYGSEDYAKKVMAANGSTEKQLKMLRKWPSSNMSEWQAYQWINDNPELMAKVDQLKNSIYNLQIRIPQNIRDNTPLDRTTEHPLI